MKKSLKIINLIDIPWYSGITEYAILQSEALSFNSHKIFFAIPKTNPKFLEISNKFKTIDISDRKKIFSFSDIRKLIQFLSENKIDIINAHTGRMQTLAYIVSSFFPKIKLIRTKADAKDIKKSFTYSKINYIICGSKYIEKMYLQKNIDKNIKTIYLSYKSIKSFPPPSKKPFLITIIGRLDPVKGHNIFIKAALKLLEKRNDIFFIIVGKEANIKWAQLNSIIPQHYKKYFKYLGYINDVYEIMKHSHIGIISSIGSEAVSRVAIEWMNSSRMIISSNVGCLPELIDTEFIYPKDDFNELHNKIFQNLDLEKISKIGQYNKEKFETLFDFNKFIKETNNVIEGL
ncbi:MAG: glycosyltransferase family 4 protein [Elusimicrobiales bacterium]|nr:glycosyltransferase family 4 protein [Elusimicrobiales bacterium]